MRGVKAALLLCLALACCARPPPSAYESSAGDTQGQAVALGRNSAGEACVARRDKEGADVYCGSWTQPSAIIRAGDAADAPGIAALAASSPWRARLEAQYECGAPRPGVILGGDPARFLACTQRIGGWPHVALVASVRGRTYYADGVLPALPAMQRAIGVVSGTVAATRAGSMPITDTDRILAGRLAAEAFGSGDIGHYNALMTLGSQANQAEDFPAAATAYRAALALQQRALGAGNPNTVAPMIDLALQLSDQGRHAGAEALFARAGRLARSAADPTAEARLLHDRALDQLNQGHDHRALALLERAERAYAAQVPPALLRPRETVGDNPVLAAFAQMEAGGDAGEAADLGGPVVQQAVIGIAETLRYQSLVLARLHRTAASAAALDQAAAIARANGIAAPLLQARLDRTGAEIAASSCKSGIAASRLDAAETAFAAALPLSLPVAETELLRAAALARQGSAAAARQSCREGTGLLIRLRLGVSADLIAPCLDAEYAAARAAPAQAPARLAAMFRMAELAQGSVTSQDIAEASARLAANARDPKVAEAIRGRQDAAAGLATLYRQRDEMQQSPESGQGAALITALDRRIAAADRRLQEADLAVQAAAPNYGSLVQQVVPAGAVLALLHRREAYLGITLTRRHAWLFLLRGGRISVMRSAVGAARMTALVRRVRASLEPTQAGLPPFDMDDAWRIDQALIAPFGKALNGLSSLTIAPSGPLLSLPFALLPTRKADAGNLAGAPWLVRRMSLAYVPAAANFVSLRKIEGDSRATQPWFGFGDFRPVTLAQAQASFAGAACRESAGLFAGLPRLPFAKLELAAAAKIFGASPGDELIGAAFTVPAVERAALKNYRILHFATHALLPTDLPCIGEPAIVTSAPAGAASADQAMLTSSDVDNLHLDADLIVLSACNTGGGDGSAGGEALSGLARSFFYAGARALMVTQWAVNDQVSAYLVAETLARLKSTAAGGAAGSLRSAQLAVVAAAGHGLPAAIANPFYWAPFVVIGDGGMQPLGAGPREAAR